MNTILGLLVFYGGGLVFTSLVPRLLCLAFLQRNGGKWTVFFQNAKKTLGGGALE